ALVRMAQDFSLRYPLIEGSGNFGSVDGDSPAAMRYTETRLSGFAGLLLNEIDQGTTEFRPTYDAMGDEPDVLPAAVPNLLLNGSSGIAVGMSCSFPPHNLREVIDACRAAIKDRELDTRELLRHIKGPDFPTGGEILDQPGLLEEIYSKGHGSVVVRGTYELEHLSRGRTNLIITSIPYSVNKSRLIERIAQLIKDKRLKHVHDVRDESTHEVRIVLELRSGDVRPDSVMAFLYWHTDLQINFPVNLIAITPGGAPDRLSLGRIVRYFLNFRYEKTVLRLQHKLDALQKRIHILEGFRTLFDDLDAAIRIIRSARSREEAAHGIKGRFELDDEQVDAILEMRLYRLVGIEIGKVLDELAAKVREARDIMRDLSSPSRLWGIVDTELADISRKFDDVRRTRIMAQQEACALQYDPEEFVEHEDTTVILSRQGWIRRMKSEVEDPASLKFREGDSLFGSVRVNTGRTVAIFTNMGKLYVMRAIDVPATTGFGEPLGNLLTLGDGEYVVGLIAPDPATAVTAGEAALCEEEVSGAQDDASGQPGLFDEFLQPAVPMQEPKAAHPARGILITRSGKGFRFDYDILREPSKRAGRRIVTLRESDETIAVKPEDGSLVLVACDSGSMLLFPVDQVPVLAGPGQGVRMIKLKPEWNIVGLEVINPNGRVQLRTRKGKDKTMEVADMPVANRAGVGKKYFSGIVSVEQVVIGY
ncbi:MAG: DNA topoisomerase, partial [Deltaproteobacteria bacterium]|nr:DNA topoisomerase [Deltaproteobacteria bacterium]